MSKKIVLLHSVASCSRPSESDLKIFKFQDIENEIYSQFSSQPRNISKVGIYQISEISNWLFFTYFSTNTQQYSSQDFIWKKSLDQCSCETGKYFWKKFKECIQSSPLTLPSTLFQNPSISSGTDGSFDFPKTSPFQNPPHPDFYFRGALDCRTYNEYICNHKIQDSFFQFKAQQESDSINAIYQLTKARQKVSCTSSYSFPALQVKEKLFELTKFWNVLMTETYERNGNGKLTNSLERSTTSLSSPSLQQINEPISGDNNNNNNNNSIDLKHYLELTTNYLVGFKYMNPFFANTSKLLLQDILYSLSGSVKLSVYSGHQLSLYSLLVLLGYSTIPLLSPSSFLLWELSSSSSYPNNTSPFSFEESLVKIYLCSQPIPVVSESSLPPPSTFKKNIGKNLILISEKKVSQLLQLIGSKGLSSKEKVFCCSFCQNKGIELENEASKKIQNTWKQTKYYKYFKLSHSINNKFITNTNSAKFFSKAFMYLIVLNIIILFFAIISPLIFK